MKSKRFERLVESFDEVRAHVTTGRVKRVQRTPRRGNKEEFHCRIQDVVDEVKKLPVLDDRSPDDIIGYNEQGHFDVGPGQGRVG